MFKESLSRSLRLGAYGSRDQGLGVQDPGI